MGLDLRHRTELQIYAAVTGLWSHTRPTCIHLTQSQAELSCQSSGLCAWRTLEAIICKILHHYVLTAVCVNSKKAKRAVTEAELVVCRLHPLHPPPPCTSCRLLCCQIKMHHVVRALVGWSAARNVSEISRVTEVVRCICVRNLNVLGLPTPPQTSTGTGLPALSQIAGITLGWQICTEGSLAVAFPDVFHIKWNSSSEMCHTGLF